MILYFSGTGNSEYVAGRIGEMVGDEAQNLFYKLKSKDKTPISSEKPWVIVTPTYAWQIPHIIRDMLLETELIGILQYRPCSAYSFSPIRDAPPRALCCS